MEQRGDVVVEVSVAETDAALTRAPRSGSCAGGASGKTSWIVR
jgi:hypothetical protein